MDYLTFTREEYLTFHQTLEGPDFKFSKVAIGMWDFMKAWDKWPVRILRNGEDIVNVCFMKVSGQAGTKVLFISNIFTPSWARGKGYAREMLDRNILEAVGLGAETMRLDCNQKALGFYDSIGLSYWGTTIEKSMFCDLPIDGSGVGKLRSYQNRSASEILDSYPPRLRTAKLKWIKKKVRRHDEFDYGHPSRYEQFMRIWERECGA